jgi:bifunctional DNA-binding transcriptional regulator/antitoxin component of YhaV-PrlF toxin-antitoxin module
MPTLKVTSKRQATFPKETCDALHLRPGDVIDLERRVEDGETLWILRPKTTRPRKWVGRLAGRAKHVTDHSIEAIRKSIAEGRKREA